MDESSPGFVVLGIRRDQLMTVDPAPGRDVLKRAGVRCYDLEQRADRQVSYPILNSDDGQGAQ